MSYLPPVNKGHDFDGLLAAPTYAMYPFNPAKPDSSSIKVENGFRCRIVGDWLSGGFDDMAVRPTGLASEQGSVFGLSGYCMIYLCFPRKLISYL